MFSYSRISIHADSNLLKISMTTWLFRTYLLRTNTCYLVYIYIFQCTVCLSTVCVCHIVYHHLKLTEPPLKPSSHELLAADMTKRHLKFSFTWNLRDGLTSEKKKQQTSMCVHKCTCLICLAICTGGKPSQSAQCHKAPGCWLQQNQPLQPFHSATFTCAQGNWVGERNKVKAGNHLHAVSQLSDLYPLQDHILKPFRYIYCTLYFYISILICNVETDRISLAWIRYIQTVFYYFSWAAFLQDA